MKHEKMPEALRLAEHLKNFRSFPDDIAAAAELERQHSEIERLRAEVDGLRIAAERAHAWMERQARQQGKGCHDTFDLMVLREERDALEAALQSTKEQP